MDIEKELADALERHLERPDGRTPPNLADSIRYSLLAPGKRIRPRLLLACGRMLGLGEAALLPPALALEMIHCFTLIHDDLPCMDDDDFRRGRPSNHKKFGEAVALLAGDGLIPLALECFLDATAHVPADRLGAALRRLLWASGPRGVVGGQAAEALLAGSSRFEELETMHAMKTGALFVASLLIPKDLAGLGDATERGSAISRFAHALGLAFQVADDLDDATHAPDPTSVLHFLSREEAASRSIKQLTEARDALVRLWPTVPGDGAAELGAIAGEVLRALEKGAAE